MKNGDIETKDSSRFRMISIYGLWIVILWLTLGGNVLNYILNLEISWLYLGIGLLLLIVPFTSPFKSYLKKPIDSKFFPISVFVGNILLILLYATFMVVYATDPYVWTNPMNKAGLILSIIATGLSVLSLTINIITYKMDRRAQEANLPSE
jgi:hypothetical protein